jgi:hypothetical protein
MSNQIKTEHLITSAKFALSLFADSLEGADPETMWAKEAWEAIDAFYEMANQWEEEDREALRRLRNEMYPPNRYSGD